MLQSLKILRLKRCSNGLSTYQLCCYSSSSSNSKKLSYYHHIGRDPLVYRTVAEHFTISAEKYGNREAVVSYHEGKRHTYAEILDKVNHLASGFINLGLNNGDRIGIWSPNTVQWYITMLAAAKAGLVSVALNPAFQAPEIVQCIKKVNIRAMVIAETFKTQNYYDMLCKCIPEIRSSTDGIIRSKEFPTFSTIILDSTKDYTGAHKFEDVMTLGHLGSYLRPNTPRPDDPCNIQFTSGTTGAPKAALLSHFNFVNNGIHVANRNYFNEKAHRICIQVPLFHVFGIVLGMIAAITHGATLVLPAPGFNPESSLRAIVDEKCTVIYGTPTMYVDLIAKQKELNLPIKTVEFAVTGGSPCSPQLFKSIKSTFNLNSVKTVYGQTELSACCFYSLRNESDEKTTETVGFIQDHMEAKVIDENGMLVPFGTPGELCLRGYQTMLGYYEDEVKTKEILSNDKWLRTGDKFILQEDGYACIVGRLKDMIIRGGENIFPKEIEDFLSTHPDIIEAQIIGVPDKRMGEEICAYLRTNEKGKSLTQTDIHNFCKESISHFKIPRYVKVVDEFPRTSSGKIQKIKLREQYVQEMEK